MLSYLSRDLRKSLDAFRAKSEAHAALVDAVLEERGLHLQKFAASGLALELRISEDRAGRLLLELRTHITEWGIR